MLAQHKSGGKPVLALVPQSLLIGVARVLDWGAQKYDLHNWRKGGSYNDFLSSALRHIFATLEGEDLDPESGLSHLAHAACNLAFVIEWQRSGKIVDDRYNAAAAQAINAGAVLDNAPVPEQGRRYWDPATNTVCEASADRPEQPAYSFDPDSGEVRNRRGRLAWVVEPNGLRLPYMREVAEDHAVTHRPRPQDGEGEGPPVLDVQPGASILPGPANPVPESSRVSRVCLCGLGQRCTIHPWRQGGG